MGMTRKPKPKGDGLAVGSAAPAWDIVILDSDTALRVKPRPRGGRGHFYMPTTYTAWRDGIAAEVLAGLRSLKGRRGELAWYQADDPLEVEILAGGKRGDADNLAGGILDALNGIVWVDDKQIRRLIVDRHAANLPAKVKWMLRVRLDAR